MPEKAPLLPAHSPSTAVSWIGQISRDIISASIVIAALVTALWPLALEQIRPVITAEIQSLIGEEYERQGAVLVDISDRLASLEIELVGSSERIIEMIADPTAHSISDAYPNDIVEMTWSFIKHRDCGPPVVNLYFRDGGLRIHNFTEASIVNALGRGISSAADPRRVQKISFTARLKNGTTLIPGPASGWVVLNYPECPRVAPARSVEIPFDILAPGGAP